MKRIAYIEEIDKMKGLSIGESAIIEFDGVANKVEVTFTDRKTGQEETVSKYHFPILLHKHPNYPHLEGNKPVKMMWETICKEAKNLFKTLPELASANDPVAKHFNKGQWEIFVNDNNKTKLFRLI